MTVSTSGTSVGRVKPCRIIEIDQHRDERGCLSVVEADWTAGFPIQRVYFLHESPAGAARGAHAHRLLEQLVIAVHGSFTIRVDDGFHHAEYRLSDPGKALYVGPMVWRDLFDFSPGAVCLVLASHHYDSDDYFRDYEQFVKESRSQFAEPAAEG